MEYVCKLSKGRFKQHLFPHFGCRSNFVPIGSLTLADYISDIFMVSAGLRGVTYKRAVLLNSSSWHDRVEILEIIEAGTCVIMERGWLDHTSPLQHLT